MPTEDQFRLPLGPVIPLLAVAVIVWLLLQMPLEEAVSVGALVGACILLYGIRAAFGPKADQ